MNRIDASLSAFALATALLSTSFFADPPGSAPSVSRHSKEEPPARKQVTFHVIGLMKTQSGAT